MPIKIYVDRQRVAGNKAAHKAGRPDKFSPVFTVVGPDGVVRADTVRVKGEVRFVSDPSGACSSAWCEVIDGEVEIE